MAIPFGHVIAVIVVVRTCVITNPMVHVYVQIQHDLKNDLKHKHSAGATGTLVGVPWYQYHGTRVLESQMEWYYQW